mgnify:FL=1
MLIPSFLVVIFLIPSAGFLIVSADSLIALENILIGITPIPRETSFFLILLIFLFCAFFHRKASRWISRDSQGCRMSVSLTK